jgi:hypothetical protein
MNYKDVLQKKHGCDHKTLQHQKKHAFASIGYLHLCIFASVCHPLLLWKCSSLIILPQLAPGCCKEENDLQPVSLFYHFGWLYLPCNTETSCLDTINRNFPRKKIYRYQAVTSALQWKPLRPKMQKGHLQRSMTHK